MDYDKIMVIKQESKTLTRAGSFSCVQVLDKGEVCEYGVPHELMCNPESVLLQLVDSTGPIAAENLKNIAAAAHCD